MKTGQIPDYKQKLHISYFPAAVAKHCAEELMMLSFDMPI